MKYRSSIVFKMLRGKAVHSLFILFTKGVVAPKRLCTPFVNNLNNLRTVRRLGVDKFTSKIVQTNVLSSACELIDTLRLQKEEDNLFFQIKEKKTGTQKGDISTLENWVTFLFCVDTAVLPKVTFVTIWTIAI